MPVDVTDKYIRIRIKDPSLFVDGSFRTITIDDQKGIKAIIGKLKSDPQGSTKTQAFLFNKDKWTVDEAKKWVEEHGKGADWIFGENTTIDEEGKIIKVQAIKKFYQFETKDFNDEERSFEAIASTEAVDREGDILRASGWKLKNFKKNPVILWSHSHVDLPIAKAENVRIEDNKLKFRPVFATAEMNPLAEQVYQLYKNKFLRAFSVRFDPIKWVDMPEEGNIKSKNFLKYRR